MYPSNVRENIFYRANFLQRTLENTFYREHILKSTFYRHTTQAVYKGTDLSSFRGGLREYGPVFSLSLRKRYLSKKEHVLSRKRDEKHACAEGLGALVPAARVPPPLSPFLHLLSAARPRCR